MRKNEHTWIGVCIILTLLGGGYLGMQRYVVSGEEGEAVQADRAESNSKSSRRSVSSKSSSLDCPDCGKTHESLSAFQRHYEIKHPHLVNFLSRDPSNIRTEHLPSGAVLKALDSGFGHLSSAHRNDDGSVEVMCSSSPTLELGNPSEIKPRIIK